MSAFLNAKAKGVKEPEKAALIDPAFKNGAPVKTKLAMLNQLKYQLLFKEE
jgi:hypothetical protein